MTTSLGFAQVGKVSLAAGSVHRPKTHRRPKEKADHNSGAGGDGGDRGMGGRREEGGGAGVEPGKEGHRELHREQTVGGSLRPGAVSQAWLFVRLHVASSGLTS